MVGALKVYYLGDDGMPRISVRLEAEGLLIVDYELPHSFKLHVDQKPLFSWVELKQGKRVGFAFTNEEDHTSFKNVLKDFEQTYAKMNQQAQKEL